jgi:hypothetical protein
MVLLRMCRWLEGEDRKPAAEGCRLFCGLKEGMIAVDVGCNQHIGIEEFWCAARRLLEPCRRRVV